MFILNYWRNDIMADNIIQSTSQAILFEEFRNDDNTPSLDILLDSKNSDEDVEQDKFPAEVKNKLGVQSFKEFMEKFAPTIYEKCIMDDDTHEIKFIYTTKDNGGTPRRISDETYYKMLCNMYIQKGQSGQSNLEFDDEKLLEMLAPQREIQEAARLRKNLRYVTSQYYEGTAKGEDTSAYAEKIYEYRKQIINKYQKSVVALLPLALEDIEKKIELLDAGHSESSGKDEDKNVVRTGQLVLDQSGHFTVKALQPSISNEMTSEVGTNSVEKIESSVYKMITADYEANYYGSSDSTIIKNLMVNTYAPMTSDFNGNLTEDLKALEDKKQEYESVYANAKSAFIEKLSPIIEKLLGVMIFFDHATPDGGDNGKLELEQGLIVANCKPAALIEGERKNRFEKYMKYIGKDQANQKCWFGILPAVLDQMTPQKQDMSNFENDILQGISINKEENNQNSRTGDELTLPVAATLLKILNDSHILTVFNSKACENNTFSSITASYIQNHEREFQKRGISYPHAVYAYPNFTIMQKRFIKITNNNAKSITVPGIYIDAAYPAAGLLVASQQVDCLRDRFGSQYLITDMDNMNFTRIDMEDSIVQKHLTTKFNRENMMVWSQSVRDAITGHMFGFAFCGDESVDDIKNTYILSARTLAKMKNQQYKPIYRVLMEDFIYAISTIKCRKIRAKVDAVLIRQLVGNWKKATRYYDENDKINFMLKKGEDIDWNANRTDKLEISFNGVPEVLDEIEVSSDDVKENQNN